MIDQKETTHKQKEAERKAIPYWNIDTAQTKARKPAAIYSQTQEKETGKQR